MIPKTLIAELLPRQPALPQAAVTPPEQPAPAPPNAPPRELGGPAGPEPTRYGDWERNGRCIDF